MTDDRTLFINPPTQPTKKDQTMLVFFRGYASQTSLEPILALSVDLMLDRLTYIQMALNQFRDFAFEARPATQTVII